MLILCSGSVSPSVSYTAAKQQLLPKYSILAWVFVVLGDSYDLDTHTWNPTGRILRQQDFWFVFGMTVL